MVPSKQTRPLATRPNNCLIDSLPSEILHIVCTHLKPTDVANLRLASSVIAPIGLQYLVPEVYLVIAEESFRNLAAIATHPVVSKYVTSLFYQADTLEVHREEVWRENVLSSGFQERTMEICPRHMLQSRKAAHLTHRPVRRHYHNKKQLKEAFRKYQGFCKYQDRAHRGNRKIVTAMEQLPNLKELTMSARVWPNQKGFEVAFGPGLWTQREQDVEGWPLGLVQMRSLLLGAYHAGSKIERLTCEQVNWRILTQENKTFERMKKSLRHLRELSITFSIGVEVYEDELECPQLLRCQKYLRQSGRLKEFVTSAPDLERLEICFFELNDPVYPTEIQNAVGDFYWPSLRAVKFERMAAAADHLVAFLERHACTIKDLSIGSFALSLGGWYPVFERTRSVLQLDSVHLSGRLESRSELLDFDEEPAGEQIELRGNIESYLLGDNTDRRISLYDYLCLKILSSTV